MEGPKLEQVDVPCDPPALEQAPGKPYDSMEREAHSGAGLLAGCVTL